ncbi:MAG: hypothetical protein AMS23_04235 [Bacteroides sp. SM1_62]|nr:MAG: hypothetical protein AMS26_15630 [Bacteroides sp. SM23_62]KPL25859.1 MAG: hypothetical protein AMS23_04235 [Bacteroides sp. SM1_62]
MLAQEMVTGGNMEDGSSWQVWDAYSTVQADVEFNYTFDTPAAGKGGCLNIFASASSWTQTVIMQELTLEGGELYRLHAAFKELTGGDLSGNWTQLYLSTEVPVEGNDYDPPGARWLGFNGFSGCGGSGVDGTFQDDACEGPGPLYLAPGEGEVTVYLVLKAGCWTDGSYLADIDILVDEISLVHVTNLVVDPGFEKGTAFTDTAHTEEQPNGAPGWNYYLQGEGAFLDDLYPHTGSWCATVPEIALPPGSYLESGFGQYFEGLTPGESYIMTTFGRLDWYTGTGDEWGLYVGIKGYDITDPLVGLGTSLTSNEYVPIILNFTNTDTAGDGFMWVWKSYGGEGNTDDWGLWPYHNLLKNADFEDEDTLAHWDLWNYGGFIDSSQERSGTYAGGMEGVSWGGGFAQRIPVSPKATYGLKGYAKVESEGDEAYFGVKNYNAAGDEVSFIVSSTDYNEGTIYFTVGADCTSAEVYYWKDGPGKAYCDDFLLCKMIDAAEMAGIEDQIVESLPTIYRLDQNYPNPFNPTTTISYSVPAKGKVKLEIYNMLGQRIKTLVNSSMPAGNYEATWDAKDDQGRTAASGVYFYRLTASGDITLTKKMLFLK